MSLPAIGAKVRHLSGVEGYVTEHRSGNDFPLQVRITKGDDFYSVGYQSHWMASAWTLIEPTSSERAALDALSAIRLDAYEEGYQAGIKAAREALDAL